MSRAAYNLRKRVMVTGGAGFLGSHLCDRLVDQGHEVLCVDNLFTGTKQNIAHLLGNPNFEFLRHDVTFPLFVEVDEIYNLACRLPIHYQHDPVQTTRPRSTARSTCLGSPSARLQDLQASTSEVYGDPGPPANGRILGNVNPWYAFLLRRRQALRRNLFLIIFASTGCRSRWRGSSTPMVQGCTGGWPVVSNSSCRRSGRSYHDLRRRRAPAILLCRRPDRRTDAADEVARGRHRSINLGNPSNSQLSTCQAVIALTGSKSALVHAELPPDDPRQRSRT